MDCVATGAWRMGYDWVRGMSSGLHCRLFLISLREGLSGPLNPFLTSSTGSIPLFERQPDLEVVVYVAESGYWQWPEKRVSA